MGKLLLRCVCSAAREALGAHGGGAGHIVSPRAQLVMFVGRKDGQESQQNHRSTFKRRTKSITSSEVRKHYFTSDKEVMVPSAYVDLYVYLLADKIWWKSGTQDKEERIRSWW